jgi:VanZ family protein
MPSFKWIIVITYCGLIFYMSSLPPEAVTLPYQPWFLDKVFHALEFGLLGLLVAWALGFERQRGMLIAFVFACLYALLDEVHQSFVPGRNASLGDWLADAIGAGLVCSWRRWYRS